MNKEQVIKHAVEMADKERSNLNLDTFMVGGFTSPKIRHLMNNLGAISTSYLEIGCHRGATLVSAFSNNHDLKSIAIDNFSEFEDGTVENELRNNIKIFKGNVLFFKGDCWTIDLTGSVFDLYLYDGAHDRESQQRAMTHYLKHFAKETIVCVDDYDWDDVKAGTQDGFKDLEGFEVQRCFYGSGAEGWHNGFAVFLVKRLP